MTSTPLSRSLSRLALAVAALAPVPAAHAFDIVFTDLTPGGMAPDRLAAFNAAAQLWAARLSDPVTVYVTINFRNDGNNGVLGSTGSSYDERSYADVRTALANDRSSALDNTAVSRLQAGPYLSFQATNLDLTTRLDNDTNDCATTPAGQPCGYNNQFLALTTANAKALGFAQATNAANPDATIAFNGFYAGQFDFDRSNGITPGTVDFVSIAAHEIGHALGFVSGVQDVDFCAPLTAGRCAGFGISGKYDFDRFSVYSVLDLYRYSAPGVLDMRVGGRPYFSVDGGVTSIQGFSNGVYNGTDGYQPSHFIPGPVNLMNPYGFLDISVDPTAADLAAFDAMGWDLATAVPEPGTWATLLAGMVAMAGAARRRSRAG